MVVEIREGRGDLARSSTEKKYKIGGSIRQIKQRPTNSHIWNDLLKVKDIYT
jgi:hypothetical protein